MNGLRRAAATIKNGSATVLAPVHLRRTGIVAVIVGTWLTAFNHGSAIVAGAWTAGLAVKVGLNFVTPFVVSNVGLLSRTRLGE